MCSYISLCATAMRTCIMYAMTVVLLCCAAVQACLPVLRCLVAAARCDPGLSSQFPLIFIIFPFVFIHYRINSYPATAPAPGCPTPALVFDHEMCPAVPLQLSFSITKCGNRNRSGYFPPVPVRFQPYPRGRAALQRGTQMAGQSRKCAHSRDGRQWR